MGDRRLTAEQSARVEQLAPRVASLARSIARQASHASADELQSAGYEGLVEAALRYEPGSGVPFSAFAHYRIRGAMIDAARRAVPELRRQQRAMRALEASQRLLEQAERDHAAAGDRRSLRERVTAAAELVRSTTTAVLLARAQPPDPDSLVDAAEDAERMVERSELHRALAAVLDACTDQERAMIDALYHRGVTMHEHAREVGKSPSTVSRQHARLIARLGARLRAHRQR